MKLALFDLDGTLIEKDSDHAFGDFLIACGWADAADHKARNDAFYADYLAGTLDLDAYIEFATRAWRTRPLEDQLELRSRFMREVMQPMIRPQALELVRGHQAAGDQCIVITATNAFVTRPIAEAFGVGELIAVELETAADGRATGRVAGTPSFQAGKVQRLAQWLAARGRRWEDVAHATFYSDSTNDLPLLEKVHEPVATNPSPALAAVARARGWRVLNLFSTTP